MITQIFAICLFPLFSFVRADLFDGYTQTALIPWTDERLDKFADNVHIDMHLSCSAAVDCDHGRTTTNYRPAVDTGSTGIMLVADEIPDFVPGTCPTADIGWQYLTSSDKLYQGCWIPREVIFNKDSTRTTEPETTATVKVLAVTSVASCDSKSTSGPYDVLAAPSKCPDPAAPTSKPTTTRILGIGFGRQWSGKPQGTPDKNPFLRIKTIGGASVSRSRHRRGWVITKQGVHVGLTNTNAGTQRGFRYTPLPVPASPPSRPPVPRHPLDWGELKGSIKFHYDDTTGGMPPITVDTPWVQCSVLLDTGIQNGFVRLASESDAKMPRQNRAKCSALEEGSIVHIRFGDPVTDGEDFKVAAPDMPGIDATPDNDICAVYSSRLPRFVNTGSHAFRLKEMSFDASGGRVAFASA